MLHPTATNSSLLTKAPKAFLEVKDQRDTLFYAFDALNSQVLWVRPKGFLFIKTDAAITGIKMFDEELAFRFRIQRPIGEHIQGRLSLVEQIRDREVERCHCLIDASGHVVFRAFPDPSFAIGRAQDESGALGILLALIVTAFGEA